MLTLEAQSPLGHGMILSEVFSICTMFLQLLVHQIDLTTGVAVTGCHQTLSKVSEFTGTGNMGSQLCEQKLESSITYDGLDLWVQEKMLVGRIDSYKPSFFRPNIR